MLWNMNTNYVGVLLAIHGSSGPQPSWHHLGNDTCNCRCHDPNESESVAHATSCCEVCNKCGRRIRVECVDEHMQTCQGY